MRLDLAGAWSDVAPFAVEERGVVINAAIDLRTRVVLRAGQPQYRLRSDDLDDEVSAASIDELAADGSLALLKAAIRRNEFGGCDLTTSAEAPPGSGLGTSGALSVALTAAIASAQRRTLTPVEIAHEAWQLETIDAAVAGGQQDQYAAALGGFQHLVFDHGTTTATLLTIDAGFAAELAAHTVICYTGRSRFSGSTISRVMAAYQARDPVVVNALRQLAGIGEMMLPALAAGDLGRVGELIAINWKAQQQLAPGMRTAAMARLEAAMMQAGAIGGKAAGAGAGGTMFFIVPGDTAEARAAAEREGVHLIPTRWADRGVSVD
ncbi:MAG: hypothetical protein ABUL71_03695 [Gemmatimonadota bacterium]